MDLVLFCEGMMKTKMIRNLIVAMLLVFIGGVVVYCTNTTSSTQDNKALGIKTQDKDLSPNADKSQVSKTQDDENLATDDIMNESQNSKAQNKSNVTPPLDSNLSALPTDKSSNKRDDISSEIAAKLQPQANNTALSKKQDSKTQTHSTANTQKASSLQDRQPKMQSEHMGTKNNEVISSTTLNKDSATKNNIHDEVKSSRNSQQMQDKSTTSNSKERRENTSNVNQMASNHIVQPDMTQGQSTHETRVIDPKESILDSHHTDTQDSRVNHANTENRSKNSDNPNKKNTQSQDNTSAQNTQGNLESIKDLQSSNTKENNQYESENQKTSDKQNSKQDEINQIQPRDDSRAGSCIVALRCNSNEIMRKFATTSLDLHASMRASEETRLKGKSAGDEFMRLWKQTRTTILPKLTSHITNIYEQDSQVNRNTRICVANYYTEVLEDFGNGWKDKKGDKSPIYQVTYQISCKDSHTAKLTILNESQLQERGRRTTFVRKNIAEQKPIGRIPPKCDSELVHKQLAQAGFYKHAITRAQEEGRRNGIEAQQRFIELWDKTKTQIITKLTAHVSNIEDKGIQAKTQKRMCVANYYTEVLEDFGNGWKDKKGDKSPHYIVYYAVAYANNEDEAIIIDITAQNRVRIK